MTVHLQTCPTVINEREVSRLIEVEWEAAPTETYPIAIRVEAYDRTGLLSDITQVVAENKVNIVAAHVGVTPDHTAVVTATLQVAFGLAAGPGHEPDRDTSRTSSASSATSAELGGRGVAERWPIPSPTRGAPARLRRDARPSEPRAARATCCRPRPRDLDAPRARSPPDLAARYGYRRIETPMFEQTDVFERGVGEVTDIVEKELFRLAPRTEEAEALGAPARSRPPGSSGPTSSTGCRPGPSR